MISPSGAVSVFGQVVSGADKSHEHLEFLQARLELTFNERTGDGWTFLLYARYVLVT